jgi:hypothetical protein
MDKKPNVFPSKEQKESIDESAKQAAFEAEKMAETQQIYLNSMSPQDTPSGHSDAVEMMRRRTEQQLNMNKQQGMVKDQSLSETPAPIPLTRQEQEILEIRKRAEEQIKIRDEHLAKNSSQTQNYQQQYNEAYDRKNNNQNINQNMQTNNYQSPAQQPITQPQSYGQVPSSINPHILELSQPNYNSPFDVLPLPSEGKLYRSKKPSIRVGYMTTSDENILTSPNLLESGQFLEILINRKILEPELRYKDLNVGDRNAIMLWLRATAYGEMYPVTILDENNVPFDTEINLNELKTKKLGAEPDSEGLISFVLPLSKASIKFKLITCGDLDDIEAMVKRDEENKLLVNNSNTYAMERMIVEVNGDRDRSNILSFINSMRVGDGKKFTEYVESISSGIDLDIEVRTPGGGSVKTFLPLNINFFWPNARV